MTSGHMNGYVDGIALAVGEFNVSSRSFPIPDSPDILEHANARRHAPQWRAGGLLRIKDRISRLGASCTRSNAAHHQTPVSLCLSPFHSPLLLLTAHHTRANPRQHHGQLLTHPLFATPTTRFSQCRASSARRKRPSSMFLPNQRWPRRPPKH
jgi:hypothetical protein